MKRMIKTSFFLAGLLISTAAFSHDWYEWECCGGYDCGKITNMTTLPNGDLDITIHIHVASEGSKHGWLDFDKRAIFPAGFEVRTSRDGDWHACIVGTDTPKCIYIGTGN